MEVNALVLDLGGKARVVITRSDVLGGSSWRRDFKSLPEACVVLEEVGLIPSGEAASTLGRDFKEGLIVSENKEIEMAELLRAGFSTEKVSSLQ